jgi:hypothetical protein
LPRLSRNLREKFHAERRKLEKGRFYGLFQQPRLLRRFMVPMHGKIERELSMNPEMWGLIFNDLRGLTPHPWSLSPLRGEGAAIGQ